MQPPMLWPMTTMGFRFGIDGSRHPVRDAGGLLNGVRVAGRVAEEPELVFLPDDGIAAQGLDERGPGGMGVAETMDAEDGDFFRIVGLKQGEAGPGLEFAGSGTAR